jgi:hypothetical protein
VPYSELSENEQDPPGFYRAENGSLEPDRDDRCGIAIALMARCRQINSAIKFARISHWALAHGFARTGRYRVRADSCYPNSY